jgi:hypothetical protein
MFKIICFSWMIPAFLFGLFKNNEPSAGSCLNEVISEHAKKVQHSGLRLIGSGGSYPDKIKGFTLHFEINSVVSKDEAKKLIISSAEKFLNEVNKDDKIKNFLEVVPVTFEQLDYAINFVDERGKMFRAPHVSYVMLYQGFICFGYVDPSTGLSDPALFTKERIEDAINLK